MAGTAAAKAHGRSFGEAMKEFHFRAPTLFDKSAKASVEDELMLHDARGMAEHLASFKNLALWLKSQMLRAGVAAGC
jgi:hypothetical protein